MLQEDTVINEKLSEAVKRYQDSKQQASDLIAYLQNKSRETCLAKYGVQRQMNRRVIKPIVIPHDFKKKSDLTIGKVYDKVILDSIRRIPLIGKLTMRLAHIEHKFQDKYLWYRQFLAFITFSKEEDFKSVTRSCAGAMVSGERMASMMDIQKHSGVKLNS